MKIRFAGKLLLISAAISVFAATLPAQKVKRAAPAQAAKAIIFAVLNDGTTLEPIANITNGKLEEPVSGGDEPAALAAFHKAYYRRGTSYKLIFGGAAAGTSAVRTADPKSDCAKNKATAITKSIKTPIKGLVMALATNAAVKPATTFLRRPTTEEKNEADALVKIEFGKQKLTPSDLRYHNLTALDLENDGTAELVGSYWVEIDKLTRGLLFFIAAKAGDGKYAVGFSEFKRVDQADVMSADIKDVDKGIYNELLLDAFDYDVDGTSNIFTYVQSFEGAGFNAYSKSGGKWVRSYEMSNYHCGY